MAGPPTLQGPFRVPSFNPYISRRLQPWIYLAFAFIFLMSSGIYGGAMSQVMGEYSLKREDVLMIVMCNVVGVNMPFPMLFRMKFRFTNRQLLINAAFDDSRVQHSYNVHPVSGTYVRACIYCGILQALWML